MKQYVVDAFSDVVFGGNPAAVCVLDEWIPESLMMSIARENNLSETAFVVAGQPCHHLRWFTPGGEIDLCGHATLATAYVMMNFHDTDASQLRFETKGGMLTVRRDGDLYVMDFPAYRLARVPVTDGMERAIGVRPVEAWMGRDLMCVLEDEAQVRSVQPDMERVMALDGLLLHVTAAGRDYDCVSRSFAPKLSVPEDPVCGSGHCHIVPLWAAREHKETLVAYQASRRGGTLHCRMDGDRVTLAGTAALYSIADLYC